MTKQSTLSHILIKKFDLEEQLITVEAGEHTEASERKCNQLRTSIDFYEEKLIQDEEFLETFHLN